MGQARVTFWRKQRVGRSWVAMIAAYALALQALLGAVAMGQVAASADPFVICHTKTDGQPSQAPDGSHECQLCMLAKGFAAVVAPDHVVVARTVVLSPVERVAVAARISFVRPRGSISADHPA